MCFSSQTPPSLEGAGPGVLEDGRGARWRSPCSLARCSRQPSVLGCQLRSCTLHDACASRVARWLPSMDSDCCFRTGGQFPPPISQPGDVGEIPSCRCKETGRTGWLQSIRERSPNALSPILHPWGSRSCTGEKIPTQGPFDEMECHDWHSTGGRLLHTLHGWSPLPNRLARF